MEKFIVTTGKTIDLAVTAALQQLGMDRDSVSVEGLENVIPLSVFRSHDFVQGYGIQLADGPLRGLTARAVIVIDENGKVRYTQLVKEVSNEPDYEAALQAANEL